jgi:hypothetical protein
VWNGAAALAHQWTPSRWFNVLYGARVEANVFGDRPPANAALERALGVRTGAAPARLHVSPRAASPSPTTATARTARHAARARSAASTAHTAGVVRGGIGEFRDLLRPGLLADASASTGLPGSTALLSCVGSAVPEADFALFASTPAAIPTACAGAGACWRAGAERDAHRPLVRRAALVARGRSTGTRASGASSSASTRSARTT